MKCLFAVFVIWIPLAILLTACYPAQTALRCSPSQWANNNCIDDRDRVAEARDTFDPPARSEPPTKPDKPDPDPDPKCPKDR